MAFRSSKPHEAIKLTALMDSINSIIQKDNELFIKMIAAKLAEIIKLKMNQPDAKTYLVIKMNDINYLIHDEHLFKKDQQVYRPFHVKLKDNAYECITQQKSPFTFVSPAESKLGILKSVKQPDALDFINHEIKMLNLTGNSDAKVSIVIGDERYIAMKDAGTTNLDDALKIIEFNEIIPCFLKAMQNLIKMHEIGIFHNDVTLNNIMFPSGEWVDFEYATSASENYDNIPQLRSLKNTSGKDVKDFADVIGLIIVNYEYLLQDTSEINLLLKLRESLENVKVKDNVDVTLPLLKSAEKMLIKMVSELPDFKNEEKFHHLLKKK
jgi:tRNA A-37 threonylcarbamoyl transferase component Bud32